MTSYGCVRRTWMIDKLLIKTASGISIMIDPFYFVLFSEQTFRLAGLGTISEKKKKKKNIHEPRHVKTNQMVVRPAKTQISLGIRSV